MSTISKTEFTFTVLHRTDEPVGDLDEALARSFDGHAVGLETVVRTTPVPDADVTAELVALNNDGTFFDDDLDDDNLAIPPLGPDSYGNDRVAGEDDEDQRDPHGGQKRRHHKEA